MFKTPAHPMRRRPGLVRTAAVTLTLSVLAVGCSDDTDDAADVSAEAADDNADTAETPESDLGASACALDEDQVSAAVGRDVTFEGISIGGTAHIDAEADFSITIPDGDIGGTTDNNPDGTEDNQPEIDANTSFGVGWESCHFVDDQDMTYMIGLLIDESGQPDLTSFEQLVALADDSNEDSANDNSATDGENAAATETGDPEVGDDSYIVDGELVVLDGDQTYALSLEQATDDNPAGLANVAETLVDNGDSDAVALCDTAVAAAAEEWGDSDTPSMGSGGGVRNDRQYQYDTCNTGLPDGSRLSLEFGDADLFDILADGGISVDEPQTELVDGIGDEAVRHGQQLFVRVDDVAVTADAYTSSQGEPDDAAVIDTLAAALVEATRD